MKITPEDWLDQHKAEMPEPMASIFEYFRMYLRAWPLFEAIQQQLSAEMIAHFCRDSDVEKEGDDDEEYQTLTANLQDCANYHILNLCKEIEFLLDCNDHNKEFWMPDEVVHVRSKFIDVSMELDRFKESKITLQETVDILQNSLLKHKKELLEIESKWWEYYKYTFQMCGMEWQSDAFKILYAPDEGKTPEEIKAFTHEAEFVTIYELVESIEEVSIQDNEM